MGLSQIQRLDYDEMVAAVIYRDSLRCVLHIGTANGCVPLHLDIKATVQYRESKETFYTHLPEDLSG
jgi:hypothetical protein